MSKQETLERISKPSEMIEFYLVDADGTGNVFETDQAVADTPTLTLTTDDPRVSKFEIMDITFYMNQTNAVTYELMLLEGAVADDVTSLSKLVWTSGAAMADVTRYVRVNNEDELPKIVELDDEGLLYYMLDWSGAPGNTPGFVRVRGRKLA